jgi:hypothetical protein
VFNWAPRHAQAWGSGGIAAHTFLTSVLDGGEWLASRPGQLYSRGKTPLPNGQEDRWTQDRSERCVREKMSVLSEVNPGRPVRSPVTVLTGFAKKKGKGKSMLWRNRQKSEEQVSIFKLCSTEKERSPRQSQGFRERMHSNSVFAVTAVWLTLYTAR